MPDNKKAKKTCFIVGPIGEAGSPVRKLADWMRDGIIKPVLEDDEFDYHVKRADEDAAPGSISNAVINDLVNADLVIADLTGFNPNAFYELGIRHALQKPTIHMIAEPVRLPFDNADQRTIFVNILDYQEVIVAREALRNGVRAVNSDNYHVNNPVTQAASANAMKNSADPKDQVIANLQERIERLENRNRPSNKGFEYLSFTNPNQTALEFNETAADPKVSRATQLLKWALLDPSKNESLPLNVKLALWDRDADALSKCMAAGIDADFLKQARSAVNSLSSSEAKAPSDDEASTTAPADKGNKKK